MWVLWKWEKGGKLPWDGDGSLRWFIVILTEAFSKIRVNYLNLLLFVGWVPANDVIRVEKSRTFVAPHIAMLLCVNKCPIIRQFKKLKFPNPSA